MMKMFVGLVKTIRTKENSTEMEEEIMMNDEKVINRKFVIDNQEKLDLAISFNISKTILMVIDSIKCINDTQDRDASRIYKLFSSTKTLFKNGNDELENAVLEFASIITNTSFAMLVQSCKLISTTTDADLKRFKDIIQVAHDADDDDVSYDIEFVLSDAINHDTNS